MKKRIVTVTLMAALGVQAGTTMVNWGAADTGADMFAVSANHNPKAGTVYTPGNVYGDETIHSVSSVAPLESQTYNAAAYATVAITISKDIHDTVGSGSADGGDSVYMQAPDSTFLKAMVVWENFATTNTTLESIGCGGRYVGSGGTFSYLIEKEDGSWYISDPALTLSLSYTSASSTNPASLAWYTFTPLNGDGGIIGSVATPSMADITSVGVYADITKSTAGNTGFKLNYFNASAAGTNAPPVNQPPAFAEDPLYKPNADIGVAYMDSIAGDASDPESDLMTFSLVGPVSWLNVASNGTLSGTPGAGDAGPNSFTVQVSATGGVDTATMNITVNPPPTGWEEFVEIYGLSGDEFDDADGDAVYDIYEWAHGGDPTNPADRGVAPRIEVGTNDTVSFISLEAAHINPGITYTAEWAEELGSNGTWSTAWDGISSNAAAVAGYNKVVRELDGSAYGQLYFRNRLFDPPPAPTGRPNIIVIMCDDLGYSDVGFSKDYSFARWGQMIPEVLPRVETPEIDALAYSGMIFPQAYVPHPFCGPSRMGIMSGRYPHHIGGLDNLPNEVADTPSQEIRDNWGYEAANLLGTPTNETTMATVLQDAGYYTGCLGKWHMGVSPDYHPNNRGFDYWYGMLQGGHNYYSDGWMSQYDPNVANDYQFWLTRNGVEVDPSVDPGPGTHYLTDILSDDAVNFITNAPSEQPFFLYLCYNAPHSPMQAKAEDLIARFGGNGDDGSYSERQNLVCMMDAVDRGVGQIVDALTAKGELSNTLIVFLSDNGGREVEDDADNNPLKGGKGDVYEGGVRTPMFMYYPAVIPAGSVYDYTVTAYDFYPTFARLAEAMIPPEKVLVGKDIWDDILADRNAHLDETFFWVRYLSAGYNTSMLRNNVKATRMNWGVWRVYDLDTDISEQTPRTDFNAEFNLMSADGLSWSAYGTDPLWFVTNTGYSNWVLNAMTDKWDDIFQ